MTEDRGHPSGSTDFVGDHVKDFIFIVVIENTLSNGELLGKRGFGGLVSSDSRPDYISLANACKADRHATRIDEKVSLDIAKTSHPVIPIDASRLASKVDGTRGDTVREQREATTSSTTLWFIGKPVIFVKFCEVTLEGEMEKVNGRGRVTSDERTGQKGDSMSQCKSKIGGGRHD